MKIVLWIGHEPNQIALANKIHQRFPVTAIIAEKRKNVRKVTAGFLFEKFLEKIFLPSIGKAWFNLQRDYQKKFPGFPPVELLVVENINSEEALEFSRKQHADLFLVSGTRLIKEKMLGLKAPVGILNLHTGLSPYVKGGPNCTNWCLAEKKPHLIGNTIMWIDKGIDTGNLLCTEFTSLNGKENLGEVHLKVMEHAHELYLRSVEFLSKGKTQRIPQDGIEKGKTYYTRQWKLWQKISLILNFKMLEKSIRDGSMEEHKKKIITVPLPSTSD